jgi:hypothetical protein
MTLSKSIVTGLVGLATVVLLVLAIKTVSAGEADKPKTIDEFQSIECKTVGNFQHWIKNAEDELGKNLAYFEAKGSDLDLMKSVWSQASQDRPELSEDFSRILVFIHKQTLNVLIQGFTADGCATPYVVAMPKPVFDHLLSNAENNRV